MLPRKQYFIEPIERPAMLSNAEVYKISVLCRKFDDRAIEVLENPDLLDFYIQRHDTLYISSWINLSIFRLNSLDRNWLWLFTFSFSQFIYGKGRHFNKDLKSNDNLQRFSFAFSWNFSRIYHANILCEESSFLDFLGFLPFCRFLSVKLNSLCFRTYLSSSFCFLPTLSRSEYSPIAQKSLATSREIAC